MAEQSQNRKQSAQHVAEPGLVGRSMTTVIQFFMFAFATLVFAIVIEWVGMGFFWEAQGSQHSAVMLEKELGYLNSDFKRSAMVAEPIQFAQRFSDNFYHYIFQKTGIERGIKWLATPEPQQNLQNPHLHTWKRNAYRIAADYILAAINITSVFAVRLAVLILSAPAFVLLVLIGIIDGLVQRDIRRWSGGRESAFIYHWAKKFVMPSLTLPWMIYLAMPLSIHPNLIVLPFAVLFATAVRVMTSTFKKYL
jgi:integrating conjugative element membrane protein (TIGR03747 family)